MTRGLAALGLAAVLAAAPARAEWASGSTSEVPLEGGGGSWLVRATLNGTLNGVFLLDTGATYCVLSPTTAGRLGVAPTGLETSMQTANGPVRVPVVQVRTFDVGGNRARDVRAVVHAGVPPPLDGILGLSYLNNFSYSIDPKRRVLKLH